MPVGKPSFEIIDHTADVGLRATAENLEDLFTQAAKGMYSVLGRLEPSDKTAERLMELQADDLDLLLHDWLSELLWEFEMHGHIYDGFEFQRLEPGCLSVRCVGSRYDKSTSERAVEIKAVTYHDMRITKVGDAFQVTVIFDI